MPVSAQAGRDRASRAKGGGLLAHFAIAGVFLGLMAIQITRHQMWRDELRAWGIVLASSTVPELFHNLRYDGHPAIWYLLLWCASWFSRAPAAMQVVQAGIATGFILLIAFRSPFSRLEKVLILLNYYVVLEYAVLSRNYGIGLLIAVIYAQLRVTRPDRLMLHATVLGLLANTNIYAAIFSAALACEVTIDRLIALQWAVLRTARQLAPGAIVYAAFILICAATVKPAQDMGWRDTQYPLAHVYDFRQLQEVIVHYLDVGLVPVVFWLVGDLPTPSQMALGLTFVPIIWAVTIWAFWRDWRLLMILVLTAIGTLAFGHLIYPGSMRHWGIMTVALVVTLWMQRQCRPQVSWPALVLLALGAFAGVMGVAREAMRPDSYASEAARWLRTNEPPDVALIGTPDMSAVGVAEILGKPMYLLDCSCVDTYVVQSKRRDGYRIQQLPDRLALALTSIGQRPAVLVTTFRLSSSQLGALAERHISADQVAAFVGAFEPEEDFYLYRVAH